MPKCYKKSIQVFIFDFYGKFGLKHPFIIMRYFCHQNLKHTKFIKALKKLETTLFLLLVLFSCTSRSNRFMIDCFPAK